MGASLRAGDDAWKDYGAAGGFPRGLGFMFWTSNVVNGERRMQQAAEAGHAVVAASAEPLYLTNRHEYAPAQVGFGLPLGRSVARSLGRSAVRQRPG